MVPGVKSVGVGAERAEFRSNRGGLGWFKKKSGEVFQDSSAVLPSPPPLLPWPGLPFNVSEPWPRLCCSISPVRARHLLSRFFFSNSQKKLEVVMTMYLARLGDPELQEIL